MLDKLKDLALLMLGPLVKPLAKLMAKGAVKLVLMTKVKEDDKLLLELAKEIMAALEEPAE